MAKEEQKQTEEKLPAEVRANMLSGEKTIFFNVALFEQAQRIATMFASSTLVPDHFRGNIGNCMIGLNYAARIQADPFMVLQSLYVVHGRPGIEGKLVQAVINHSGKYSEPLQYDWLDPDDNIVSRHEVLNHKDFGEYGCQAYSIDAKSGKRVDGPKITWKLIKAEGWHDKPGPDKTVNSNKWRTMPEMMFYYRAASWFGNKNCPELKLGMHTTEELEDIVDLNKNLNGAYGVKDAATTLNEKIKSAKKPPKEDLYKVKDKTKTQKPEETKKESTLSEQEQEVYNGFIHIRKQETLRDTEQILLKEMPSWSKELRKEWSDKWERIMREPYEFTDKTTESFEDNKNAVPVEDNEKDIPMSESQEKSPEPPIMLNCMMTYEDRPEKDDEGLVNVEVCENVCEKKDKCVAFMKYKENLAGN